MQRLLKKDLRAHNMETLHNTPSSSKKHVVLLSAISELELSNQRTTSPTRREASCHISEFDISHSENEPPQQKELMKSVWDKEKLEKNVLRSKVKCAHQKVKALDHPLQGPAAAKIQRSVNFEDVKKQLNCWSAVIQSNRNAEQLKFPLDQSTVSMQTTDDVSKWKSQAPTPLEKELSAVLNEGSTVKANEPEKLLYKPNLTELKEHRQEMAKLRAVQSHMAAKAKRQKKIKSKRYRRVLRNESTRRQLKEFETLRKTDPESALKQLQTLEHARAQERASLRHRNRGRWTRNKALKAKYNIESQKVLTQQLETSRQLQQTGSGSEEEEEKEGETKNHQEEMGCDNPWVGMQTVPQGGTVASNYRKYWQQRNRHVEKISGGSGSEDTNDGSGSKKFDSVTTASGSWIVTNIVGSFSPLRTDSTSVKDSYEETDKLPFKSKVNAFIEEALDEKTHSKNMKDVSRADYTNKLFGVSKIEKEELGKCDDQYNVDPNKVILMKPKYLLTKHPDEISNGGKFDDNESDENEINVTEAFTDDDTVAEFRREKNEVLEQYHSDPNHTFPGWGEWTGTKINHRKKRPSRIQACLLDQKKSNQANVIVNDKKDEAVYQHQVNELPLAFTSVKDFEASIRAPIGNTFIPQTAHDKLTTPMVITKLGCTIKPLDQDTVLNNAKQ